MRRDDINYMATVMEFLGYRPIEFAHFLGPDYRKWKKVHFGRLFMLIEKRVTFIEKFGDGHMKATIKHLEAIRDRVETIMGAEDALLYRLESKQSQISNSRLKQIAESNQVPFGDLTKAAVRRGWRREYEIQTKEAMGRRRVIWITNK